MLMRDDGLAAGAKTACKASLIAICLIAICTRGEQNSRRGTVIRRADARRVYSASLFLDVVGILAGHSASRRAPRLQQRPTPRKDRRRSLFGESLS